jgi:hypothetical protein
MCIKLGLTSHSSGLPPAAAKFKRSTDVIARLGYPQVKKEIDFTLSAE